MIDNDKDRNDDDIRRAADARRAQILNRYADLKFIPNERPARRDRNGQRGPRAYRPARTIL